MVFDIEQVFQYLNAYPPECIAVALLICCFAAIAVMQRCFGPEGLYVYVAVALVAANIQVLKAVQFSSFTEPVALGTILIGSTFLCTDLLSECYGPRAARRCVFLGFSAGIIMSLFMWLTIGFRPLNPSSIDPDLTWAYDNHVHIKQLFTPSLSLMLAGMIAYLFSQLHDVWIFEKLKQLTRGRHLWLRNTLSTCLSGLLDNIIFSVLAWRLFAAHPIEWRVVIVTYIFGTYVIRVGLAVFDTPMMYLLKRLAKHPTSSHASTATP